jgi:hypothetical protein
VWQLPDTREVDTAQRTQPRAEASACDGGSPFDDGGAYGSEGRLIYLRFMYVGIDTVLVLTSVFTVDPPAI